MEVLSMKYSVIITLLILGNAGCSYTMNNANGRKAPVQARQQAAALRVTPRANRINQINDDALLAQRMQNEEWDIPMANSFRVDEQSRDASIALAKRLQQEEQYKDNDEDVLLAKLLQKEEQQQLEDESLARFLQQEEQLTK